MLKISAASPSPEDAIDTYSGRFLRRTLEKETPVEKMVLTLHIIVCVILVLLVLLQSGKEGMGVIFGGGSSSLFGSSGAGGILVKLTTFMAVIFLCTSLGYNLLTTTKKPKDSSIVDIVVDDPSAPWSPPLQNQGPGSTPALPDAAPQPGTQ